MAVRTLDDLDVSGLRVLIRADLNVPLADGAVQDTSRIEACLPTIREVMERGGIPIVISHLGRPKGKPDRALSLKPVADALRKALDGPDVVFADGCVGPDVEALVKRLEPGQLALLENLRFDPGETANDPKFAAELAELADAYIDDAFSAAHRAHASIVGVAEHIPSAAGRLMQKELESLQRFLDDPATPYLAILGGIKVETKLGVISSVMKKGADVALAGGMANTVLVAEGYEVGESAYDPDMLDAARSLRTVAKEQQRELILPVDAVVGSGPDAPGEARTVSIDKVPADAMVLDLGQQTVEALTERVKAARTVVWNGPLGVAEKEAFARATLEVARVVAEQTEKGELTSVVGGGDTVAVMHRAGLLDKFTYASMAGGAFLAWLEGGSLPGVEVLTREK